MCIQFLKKSVLNFWTTLCMCISYLIIGHSSVVCFVSNLIY